MKPVKVESSNITALGYHKGDFFVRFKVSGTYRYKGVPIDVAANVVFADSPGSALNQLVKPHYQYVKEAHSPFDDEQVMA